MLTKHLGHRIAFAVEAGKIELTGAERGDDRARLRRSRSRAPAHRATTFDEAIASELMRLRLAVWNCLALADIDADAIDTVFMTGGSSLVPAVEAVIARRTARTPPIKRGDDFLSVALGLTLEAQSALRLVADQLAPLRALVALAAFFRRSDPSAVRGPRCSCRAA